MSAPSHSLAPAIVWFRQDLRLADNPAFAQAAATGRPVIALYILDTATTAWPPGGASRWWLHHSLEKLGVALQARHGIPLVLRRGDPHAILPALVRETGAGIVLWNRCYEPAAITCDATVTAVLNDQRVSVETHNAALLFEPWTVKTQAGGWFKVFSPFWRACRALPDPQMPQPAPAQVLAWPRRIDGDALADWNLLPRQPDWSHGLRAHWTPGEDSAAGKLTAFLDGALHGYADGRDHPDRTLTSGLSPHLHFGEIGPRQIWHALRHRIEKGGFGIGRNAEKFLAELGWREFSHHLLFHFPALPHRSFREEFEVFPWDNRKSLLAAWQQGRTGYPIVDAGMRELWQTGWMHNRVRMITASFLVKHLRQDWRRGAAWFWDTLVDADLANNSASWQWVAGSGADAAPYFRIFNPTLQGEKFDSQGLYVRRWLPEIAALPDKYIHQPWLAPEKVMAAAGLRLGRDYPEPLVDHNDARKAALAGFAALRNDIREAAGAE